MTTHARDTANDHLFDDTAEVPFLDAIVTMTDDELATYRRRYATATDSISVIHGNAVTAEITRRRRRA